MSALKALGIWLRMKDFTTFRKLEDRRFSSPNTGVLIPTANISILILHDTVPLGEKNEFCSAIQQRKQFAMAVSASMMQTSYRAFKGFLASAVWASLISTAVTASYVCDTIASTTNIEVETPLTTQFSVEQSHYWSSACSSLLPSCILYPETADEVAAIVRVLNNSTETFAIKSGGHNPNLYYSSIEDSPLLSTAKLNEVLLDPVTQTVRVGPGNRWNDVASALNGTGFSVVGGRLGVVGVGGYLLGGGLSFMSTEYGWATDSILAFDVVFANGSIATITADNHPDLFISMRGGGNAFAIVTTFTLQAYPQGDIWGGNIIYPSDDVTNAKVLAAVNSFALNYPDEKAAIIATSQFTGQGLLPLWVVYLYYNGPTPPEGVFDDFLAITPLLNTCTTRTYADLLYTNGKSGGQNGIVSLGSEMSSLPQGCVSSIGNRTAAGLHVFQDYFEYWQEVSRTMLAVPGILSSIAFQPIPRGMARITKEKGGDLLDLDDAVDRVILEFTMYYTSPTDAPFMGAKMEEMYGGIRERVLNFTEQGVLPNAYLPLFYNDAFYQQDFSARLRPENAERARTVRQVVDPAGLFLNRTGGFKL